MIRLYLLRIY